MRPVYVVRNINCGIVGIFTNMKKTYEFIIDSYNFNITYSQLTKELRNTVNYSVDIDVEEYTSVTCFELNRIEY